MMSEPLTPERLAEIESFRRSRLHRSDYLSFTAGNAIDDLLAEVKRRRGQSTVQEIPWKEQQIRWRLEKVKSAPQVQISAGVFLDTVEWLLDQLELSREES